MDFAAIKHQAYDNFCYALDFETLCINIFTGKDVEQVFLLYGDPYEKAWFGGGKEWQWSEIEISEKKELAHQFKWKICIEPKYKRLRYCFKLVSKDEVFYLVETGFMSEKEYLECKDYGVCFDFPWMNPSDVNVTPRWAENTVWYQIFPSRFCKGKCAVVPEKLKEWGKLGEEIIWDSKGELVYGGNIDGITQKLEYLHSLGITGLYLTPIFKANSQHKYNTSDYALIDPEFGDDQAVKAMVEKAHSLGIRVIFDGVFNHTGWDFEIWQDVFNNKEKSRYKDWFMINNFNFVKPSVSEESNTRQKNYYSFAFVDKMPKLNTNNPEVQKYFIDICTKWVSEYGIDGLRLDVANEISHDFSRKLKTRMKELKSDFFMIGEIWHNALPWLRGDEFDSVMNYPLQNAIVDFCSEKNYSAKRIETEINRCFSVYYEQNNRVLFNQVDSHDTMRIFNRCGKNEAVSQIALVMLFCMPGSVCIYYGTEILLEGNRDPDNRRCMPWKEIEDGLFDERLDFTKKLISLRKGNAAFRSTKMEFLYDEENDFGNKKILIIEKSCENEKILLFVNLEENPVNISEKYRGKVIFDKNYSDGLLQPCGFVIFQV